MNRFDYVTYDDISNGTSTQAKEKFRALEDFLENRLINGRSKALVMTHLEDAFMWVGRAIRDDQIIRETGPA